MSYTALTTIPTTEAAGSLSVFPLEIAPRLLVIAAKVTTSTASVRLYRRDSALGHWVPTKLAAVDLDPAVDGGYAELRFATASIPGYYALARTAGTGTVEYVLYQGAL